MRPIIFINDKRVAYIKMLMERDLIVVTCFDRLFEDRNIEHTRPKEQLKLLIAKSDI